MASNTNKEFERVLAVCRELFSKKLYDYGASWRIMRPESLTDQIYIKAKRIRNLETGAENMVGEGIVPEFIGIVNYGLISLVQLDLGYADNCDITADEAMVLYDKKAQTTLELMKKKNHDYNEAWRGMRTTSYTDLILMKIHRTKQIEDNNGKTLNQLDSKFITTIIQLFIVICFANKLSGILTSDTKLLSDVYTNFPSA